MIIKNLKISDLDFEKNLLSINVGITEVIKITLSDIDKQELIKVLNKTSKNAIISFLENDYSIQKYYKYMEKDAKNILQSLKENSFVELRTLQSIKPLKNYFENEDVYCKKIGSLLKHYNEPFQIKFSIVNGFLDFES